VEQDCREGYCEICGSHSVMSFLEIEGII